MAAAYLRDMSQDGKDQENLVGTERPRELERLLEAAASEPRPFDVVLVYTRAVLGTPPAGPAGGGGLPEAGRRGAGHRRQPAGEVAACWWS